MDARATTLEEFLGAVLRGAAKILGCGSTSLIFINEQTQKIGIRVGTMAASGRLVAQVEQLLGGHLGGLVFPLSSAEDSLVYRAWRERKALETSSVAEIIGSAFPRLVVAALARVIGEHRFICVPALAGQRNYGVLMFQKEGSHPFNAQQRELILRYARRIGEILENDLRGQGRELFADLPAGGPEYLLFDERGTLIGGTAGEALSPEQLAELGARAAATATGRVVERTDKLGADFFPFRVRGAPAVLCRLPELQRSGGAQSLENQLLQLTLGDPVPSLFVDTSLRVTSCNGAAEKALGASRRLVGQPVGELFANPREIVAILSQQVLDPKNPYCEESASVLRPDGTVAPVRVEALLLADDRQEAVGFLLLIRDPEDDADADAVGRLVQQERLATMGELAAQLAHEMRNPLVAVGASLESLARDPSLAQEHRDIVHLVIREVLRLDMTLKDYLAARHDMSFADVELAAVADDARRLLEGACRLAGKQVVCEVPPGLSVRGDYDALKHVLFNLLLNALEASPPEGVVRLSAVAQGRSTAALLVEDRGPGLAAPAADCFRPFFTTKKNGTGLGLAVCQKIAKAHGGLVTIKNREGGGCRATVLLPRLAAPGRASA